MITLAQFQNILKENFPNRVFEVKDRAINLVDGDGNRRPSSTQYSTNRVHAYEVHYEFLPGDDTWQELIRWTVIFYLGHPAYSNQNIRSQASTLQEAMKNIGPMLRAFFEEQKKNLIE